MENAAHIIQDNLGCFNSGELVQLVIDDVRTMCLVFRSNQEHAIIVPLQVSPELQNLITQFPQSGTVKRSNGATDDFSFESAVSLVGFVAKMNAPKKRNDNRQHVRLSLRYRIEASLDGTTWLQTLGENISEGGLLMFNPSDIPVAIGDMFRVRLYLPHLEPITATGQVRRLVPQPSNAGPPRIGIQFRDISITDQNRIVRYIFDTQAKNNPQRKKLVGG